MLQNREQILEKFAALEAIDPMMLEQIRMLRQLQTEDEEDILVELIGLFIEDTPPKLQMLRQTFTEKDRNLFARTAHSLKGSSGNLGASQMMEICSFLENEGRGEELESLAPFIDLLEKSYERVKAIFEVERTRSIEN
ncbi:MAG: Hpt domain-containing protein [Blastocatellia bacterium]|nr:Hpt domain-containing protein [Blastocatellia bacterium]